MKVPKRLKANKTLTRHRFNEKRKKILKVAIKFYFRSSDKASVARMRSYWSLAGFGVRGAGGEGSKLFYEFYYVRRDFSETSITNCS